MNNIEQAIEELKMQSRNAEDCELNGESIDLAISALEKQIPKKVYHFLEDDTFETTCCGIDVANEDYNFCPNCGCKLGDVEEVEDANE